MTTSANPSAVRQPRSRADSSDNPYIVGRRYDRVFFLLPPLAALLLGASISGTEFADREFDFFGYDVSWSSLLIGIFIHAHLVIVFFRSHGNPEIFAAHRIRFIAIPVLLYAGMLSSLWVLISVSVLVTFWDVYHSALQTFGFGRIYDRKSGNDPQHGRRLDWWLNHLLYIGPIVAGATMIDHFEDFEEFEEIDSARAAFFTKIPAFMEGNQQYFTWTILAAGSLFLVYYVWCQWQFHRQGHSISPQKVFLFTSTGACSIYTWGFNSFGEAFFIMNLFHALQYFGIVWSSEKNHMMKLFRVDALRYGKPIALSLFIALPLAYGAWVEAVDTDIRYLWSITLVVSLLHFWYDGFIWSVRKQQI